MVTNAQFREQLKKLKGIKYEQIKMYGCIAVKCPIDVLTTKERGKVIYVLSASLGKAKDEYDKVNADHMIFKSNILKTIENIENNTIDDKFRGYDKYSKDVVKVGLKKSSLQLSYLGYNL